MNLLWYMYNIRPVWNNLLAIIGHQKKKSMAKSMQLYLENDGSKTKKPYQIAKTGKFPKNLFIFLFSRSNMNKTVLFFRKLMIRDYSVWQIHVGCLFFFTHTQEGRFSINLNIFLYFKEKKTFFLLLFNTIKMLKKI